MQLSTYKGLESVSSLATDLSTKILDTQSQISYTITTPTRYTVTNTIPYGDINRIIDTSEDKTDEKPVIVYELGKGHDENHENPTAKEIKKQIEELTKPDGTLKNRGKVKRLKDLYRALFG